MQHHRTPLPGLSNHGAIMHGAHASWPYGGRLTSLGGKRYRYFHSYAAPGTSPGWPDQRESRTTTGTRPLSAGVADISMRAEEGLPHIKMSFFKGPETRAARVSLLLRPDAQGMRKRTATRFGLVRTDDEVRQTNHRVSGIFVCYKRSTCGARSREWSHEDAAFLAILFQASIYVLPEKAQAREGGRR